jgi:hypothetical protein
MSKGGGGGGGATKTSKDDKGNFVSGFQPYPASGGFPILPQQNYWDKGNFMMPGVSSPLMTTDLLQRFPQLSSLFGGQSPQVQTASAAPGIYGLPPSFGQLNPAGATDTTKLTRRQQKEAERAARRNA